MSFINVPLGDAKEKEVLAEGEYTVRAESAELDTENQCIVVRHSVEGEPDAKAVFHRIWLPRESDDEEKVNNKLLFAKAYLELMGVGYDSNGFDEQDIVGQSARCNLKQDEWEGTLKNEIKLSI